MELVTKIENGEGKERERRKWGLELGRLGDPRIKPHLREHWVQFIIPAGWCDEKGVEVPEEQRFLMARYPVTNREYWAFVQAGGYTQGKWWVNKNRPPEDQPAYWDSSKWNGPNQPVVGVSAHEAEAYAAWLTSQSENQPSEWWPKGSRFGLPTAAQWSFAAMGKDKKRKYPWGDEEPNEKRANFENYGEDGLDQTTAVGLYPAGATPEGLLDMGGNVWEWNAHEVDKAARVFRGGSWIDSADSLAASFRLGSHAGDRDRGIGFRLVVPLPPERGS